MFELLRRRELDFSEFLSMSFKLFFKNLHWIALFTILFSTVLQYVSSLAITEMARFNPYTWVEGEAGMWVMMLPILFVNLIFYQFVNMMVTFIVWKSVQEEKVTWSGLISLLMNKIFGSLKIAVMAAGFFLLWGIGPLLLVFFGMMDAAVIAVLLLLLPMMYWIYNFLFVQHSLIIEDRRGVAAFRYSRGLVRGRWWNLFGKLFGAGLIWGLLNLVTLGPAQYFLEGNLIGNLLSFGLEVTSRSFTWVATTVIFLNFNYVDKRSSITVPTDHTETM